MARRSDDSGGLLAALGVLGLGAAAGGLAWWVGRATQLPGSAPAPPPADAVGIRTGEGAYAAQNAQALGLVPEPAPVAPAPAPSPPPPAPVDPTLPSPERIRELATAYGRAVEHYAAVMDDIIKGAVAQGADAEKARERLKYGATAAGAVVAVAGAVAAGTAAVPIVGQIAAAVSACVALVAQIVNVAYGPDGSLLSEQRASLNLVDPAGRAALDFFSPAGQVPSPGWYRNPWAPQGQAVGCYYFNAIPVWGPEVDQWVAQLRTVPGGDPRALKEFVNLVHRFPWGDPIGDRIGNVTVLGGGVYQVEAPGVSVLAGRSGLDGLGLYFAGGLQTTIGYTGGALPPGAPPPG